MNQLRLSFVALLIACSYGTYNAKTNVFLKNDTPYTLSVNYSSGSQPAGADLNDLNTGPSQVGPGAREKLMSVPRGGLALDPSVDYFFNAILGGIPENKKLGLSLYVRTSPIHGAGKTSSVKATAYRYGEEDAVWYDANQTRNFTTKPVIGGKEFALSFAWSGFTGDLYEDIEYTLKETGTVTDPNKLTLLQYNIQQRPPMEGLQYTVIRSHSERSNLSTNAIPSVIRQFNADVVTVNEAFTAALRPALTEQMKNNGYQYATDVLNGSGGALWSGGVMVFSKYPFTRKAELNFKNFASADKNADKGCLYVQINKNGKLYNIFATHTNASYDFGGKTRLPLTDAGRNARKGQFMEIRNFIQAQNIPQSQPVIIVGDMNVDMLSEKGQPDDEYTAMLTSLNATHPQITGPMFTFNRNANEWVNPDDGPVQYLDYALYSNDYLKPKSSFNKPICLKSNGADACVKGSGNQRDLSDHFPLFAQFDF